MLSSNPMASTISPPLPGAIPPQPHRCSTVRCLSLSFQQPQPHRHQISIFSNPHVQPNSHLCYFPHSTENSSGGGRGGFIGGSGGGSGGGGGSEGDEDDDDPRAKLLLKFIKLLSKSIADEQRRSAPSTSDSFFALFNNVGLGLVLGGVIDRITGGCFSGFFLNKNGKAARGI